MTSWIVVSVLLGFVGNVLLDGAVWTSGTLPKWAGALCRDGESSIGPAEDAMTPA